MRQSKSLHITIVRKAQYTQIINPKSLNLLKESCNLFLVTYIYIYIYIIFYFLRMLVGVTVTVTEKINICEKIEENKKDLHKEDCT